MSQYQQQRMATTMIATGRTIHTGMLLPPPPIQRLHFRRYDAIRHAAPLRYADDAAIADSSITRECFSLLLYFLLPPPAPLFSCLITRRFTRF